VTNGPNRRPVVASRVLQALADAGIVDEKDHIRRVIIDLEIGKAAQLYVERYGDDRLLAIAMGLRGGYVISYVPHEEPKPVEQET
jgi:hypothetical protein